MDAAAFALCEANQFPMVRIFQLSPDNIKAVLKGESIGTFLHP